MNNSLAEVRPELVPEWSEKNLPLKPDEITFGSNKKVWWRGACGHEWQTSVKARSNGEKCPICSGARVIAGINDLATLEPLLVKQWSKKNKIKPTEVSIGSHKKVIWRCEKGHEWEAAVKSRTINKTGCPYCSHNKVLAGFNDLATLLPDIIMILINQIITDIRIESVNDLYKLKPFLEDGTLKINKSQIARELEVDRRTVDKYINGYTKPETRNCDDCITPFYDIITELLSDKNQQVFYYRKVLWQYLVDNHGFKGVYCNFCHYLRKYPEFDSYFRKSRPSNTNKVTVRYETPMGKQAQLDWKESILFILSSGETIEVNIFVLLLSYSRFRVYRVSLSKTQDILFSFLDDAFETLGGIPDEIVTDNMKTVMDEARTEYYAGKVNNKFQQFADDYGFKVQPCIAGHPHTKAKVEAPMKILDEIRAYNGKLNYIELVELVTRINNRVNTQVNQGTGRIPLMYYNKEKAFLNSLPADNIRKPYQITTNTVKVNHSSMFNYKSCQYSVPPEYIDKIVSLQVYDGYIHVYCNTEFITIHQLSSKKLNYISEHYAAIARKSHIFRDEHIMDRAKENLEIIGKVYDYE